MMKVLSPICRDDDIRDDSGPFDETFDVKTAKQSMIAHQHSLQAGRGAAEHVGVQCVADHGDPLRRNGPAFGCQSPVNLIERIAVRLAKKHRDDASTISQVMGEVARFQRKTPFARRNKIRIADQHRTRFGEQTCDQQLLARYVPE